MFNRINTQNFYFLQLLTGLRVKVKSSEKRLTPQVTRSELSQVYRTMRADIAATGVAVSDLSKRLICKNDVTYPIYKKVIRGLKKKNKVKINRT
jgi:hypothetical protein